MNKEGKLTLKDYVTMPVLELAEHEDFNQEYFWLAVAMYYDVSMAQLFEYTDLSWVKRFTT